MHLLDSRKCRANTFKSYHTINRAAFVCLSVCSLSPPRSFDRSSPNLVGVCRWTSELPLRGSFSKRSTARRVNGSLSLSTILYMHQPHATRCNGSSCLQRVAWGWCIYNIVESESDPLTRRAVDLFEKEPLKGNSEVHLHTPTKFGEDRSKDLGGDREQTDKQTNRQTDKRCSIYSMICQKASEFEQHLPSLN